MSKQQDLPEKPQAGGPAGAGPPAPVNRQSDGPRDAFLYILSFFALYVTVIGAAALLWGLAEAWFEDPLDRTGGSAGAIRGAISMVVISYPIFLYLAITIRKKLTSGEMSGDSTLRKVLIYLTLFLIAITAIIDLIVILNAFLSGELTGRFAVRSISLLALAGLVFEYFRQELAAYNSARREAAAG